jgi:hypothetical protein
MSALCQWKHLVGGIVEFPANVEYLRSLGIACWHVDPGELRLRGRRDSAVATHPST